MKETHAALREFVQRAVFSKCQRYCRLSWRHSTARFLRRHM